MPILVVVDAVDAIDGVRGKQSVLAFVAEVDPFHRVLRAVGTVFAAAKYQQTVAIIAQTLDALIMAIVHCRAVRVGLKLQLPLQELNLFRLLKEAAIQVELHLIHLVAHMLQFEGEVLHFVLLQMFREFAKRHLFRFYVAAVLDEGTRDQTKFACFLEMLHHFDARQLHFAASLDVLAFDDIVWTLLLEMRAELHSQHLLVGIARERT
mmetsp:Transcript_22023/g.35348  ORF Transcript_22023/g.35348 Transcript_22023/m.35348 type:complete len:208 (-) Transcript_22023:32-655(-)